MRVQPIDTFSYRPISMVEPIWLIVIFLLIISAIGWAYQPIFLSVYHWQGRGRRSNMRNGLSKEERETEEGGADGWSASLISEVQHLLERKSHSSEPNEQVAMVMHDRIARKIKAACDYAKDLSVSDTKIVEICHLHPPLMSFKERAEWIQ